MTQLITTERDQQQKQELQQEQAQRAALVQKLLAPHPDLPSFMHELLRCQAHVVAGTEAAGFVLETATDDEGKPRANLKLIDHLRPDGAPEDVRRQAIQAFREIVGPCLQQKKDGAIAVGAAQQESEPQFCLVTLLWAENRVVAATAVICRCRDERRARDRLRSMQLVAGYFDFYMLRRSSEHTKLMAAAHQDVLQFSSAVATAEGFQNATANLCNEMATRFGADRVSLGWVKGARGGRGAKCKLMALSHTEEFDRRQELSTQIVAVMEESADQDEVVQYDPKGNSTANITREAQRLSIMEGNKRVTSMPLRNMGEVIGVVTLEFPETRPSTPQETTSIAVATELLAPQLYDRHEADRWLVMRAGSSLKKGAGKVVGPQYMLAKLITVAVIGLLAFLTFYTPMYQVKAPFTLVPAMQRELSAPISGTILEVLVEPGDRVESGTPLLRFDTSDLRTQLDEAIKQREVARREALAAEGENKVAEGLIAQKRMEAAQASIVFFESQIAKATITSPIDGVVLQGNLEDRIGDTVQAGENLFVIGDPATLFAELRVPEKDIQEISLASVGELATSTRPGDKYPIAVMRITPMGQAVEGKNVFAVRAELDKPVEGGFPGVQGTARIDVEERPLIVQWTRPLIDWVRLQRWL